MNVSNELNEEEYLEVEGARVHNLKNVSLKIPRNKLVVITGLSGSGKSSLAFDTIYAEGQRRYIESFGSYARQFLGTLERPDVDKISGLSPVISIEQKTINRNPRSTVGTITEVYDFFRLMYARLGTAHSYVTGKPMVKLTENQIYELIFEKFKDEKIYMLSPLVKGRKGHYKELFESSRKKGFTKIRVDGKLYDLADKTKVDRYKIHDIELVIDRLSVEASSEKRIKESLRLALKLGKGTFMVMKKDEKDVSFFSRNLMCLDSGIAYDDPAPNLFSFNSNYGACRKCSGLGVISEIDLDKIVPDKSKSILQGAIAPLGAYKNNWIYQQIEALGSHFDFNLKTKFNELSEEAISSLLYGSSEPITIKSNSGLQNYEIRFEGIVNFIQRQSEENPSKTILRWANSFMNKIECPECNGARLKKEALYFKIANKNIAEIAKMSLTDLAEWVSTLSGQFSEKELIIANEILKEITARIKFLLEVGLDYLTLNRSSATLSGGEAQRIRLATQVGSQLVGVMYILDEPSIGLHQRDNMKLISSLQNLRDIGNSVLVVEHDKDIMLQSDYLIDIGPGAGLHGGKIVAEGTPKEFMDLQTPTIGYLNGSKKIEIPAERRKGSGKSLKVKGASGNNLKDVDVEFPLGKFICVTGVSGSGKSSLINHTLYPILNQFVYNGVKEPLPYKKIEGLKEIDKVVVIDQAPIGRTPRSNPATYTNVFNDIRLLYSMLTEAKIRGYKPGRFSFNVKGGRCETCQGAGVKTIEMNFLPDVMVECSECNGKRYNRETLEVRFKGKSISDVLAMPIADALEFFENQPQIKQRIQTLNDVGLGYVKLGQPAPTLSGGEAQRIKLATELSKKQTGKTVYILDEPTTGLHFDDIKMLLKVLNDLVDLGNTVIVIEHNMDVIKSADYIIDIGPEGGEGGGEIVAVGAPEEIIKSKKSYTAKFLKDELN
jgi:excinuclease ABC subunit A